MGLSRAEVAERAGVAPAFIDRLCTLRILKSAGGDEYAEGDVRRTRIAQALDEGGLSLDGVAKAIEAGALDLGFVDAAAYERFTGLTDVTFADAAARAGLPMEIVLAIREASGSSAAAPDDRMRPSELEAVPALRMEVEHGVRPTVVERSLRAVGESARRMAEVEADW
jgi:hypothetical protein